jgi:O-antigen ligase
MAVGSRVRGQRRPLASLALAGLVIPAALFWTSLADPGLDRRLTAGLDESSSDQPSRLAFWSVALDMEHDHPWLGVGPDNYRWLFATYAGVPADNLGVHAHNQYLEALADTGLLGLLTLGWLLTQLLRTAVSAVISHAQSVDWPWRLALLASLVTWLLHAVLDDFERFWPASVAVWLIAGLSLRQFEPHRTESDQQTFGRIALADEVVDSSAEHFVPLLGSTAQNHQLAVGKGSPQTLEHTAGPQTGQVPIE